MKIIWFVKIISLRFQPSPLLAIFVESSDVVYVWKQMCRPKKTCRPNPRPKVSCVIMYFRIWIRFIHPPPCVPTVSSLSISNYFNSIFFHCHVFLYSSLFLTPKIESSNQYPIGKPAVRFPIGKRSSSVHNFQRTSCPISTYQYHSN